MTAFQDKILTLRSFEEICYSICMHLLRSEKAASLAAKQALLAVFEDQQFWTCDASGQMNRIRRTTIRECMQAEHNKKGETNDADT